MIRELKEALEEIR